MTADEVKRAVLAAGKQLLTSTDRSRFSLGVELTEAITAAGVPKSSAYRLFSAGGASPQAAFTAELVKALVAGGTHTDPAITTKAAADLVAETPPGFFETGSGEELAALLRELIRLVSWANLRALRETPEFGIYVTALASVGDPGPEPDEHSLAAALVDAEQLRHPFVDVYRELAELFGLRLRPGWTWDMVAKTGTTTAYGAALLYGFNPEANEIMRPTGPGGELQSWSWLGVQFEGLVLTAAEPNPRVVNAADIRSWIA